MDNLPNEVLARILRKILFRQDIQLVSKRFRNIFDAVKPFHFECNSITNHLYASDMIPNKLPPPNISIKDIDGDTYLIRNGQKYMIAVNCKWLTITSFCDKYLVIALQNIQKYEITIIVDIHTLYYQRIDTFIGTVACDYKIYSTCKYGNDKFYIKYCIDYKYYIVGVFQNIKK